MDVESEVAAHYGRGNLERAILDALTATGKDAENLAPSDLSGADEFHLGWHTATQELARQLGLTPEMHVLDIGSGLGGPARYFAETYGCRVTGIDLTPGLAEAANALTRRCGLADRVAFRQASALIHVGMNIGDKSKPFGEMRRVLKNGARIGVYDVMRVQPDDTPPPPNVPPPTVTAADPAARFILAGSRSPCLKGTGIPNGEGHRMERRGYSGAWRSLFALLIIAALGAAAWQFGWREQAASYEIQTAELSRGSIERSISATGSVQALVTVAVSSQLSGQISELNSDFNSKVAKGASLAVIDPRTFAARVASAEANLAIAKTTVAVEEATIVKAQALLDQAQRSVERQRTLAANNATPATTLDTAETLVETAKADLQVAQAQLANARATIAQREADLSQARLDLARTQIRSPIDGVVIARNIDLGATVAASLQAPILFQIAQDLTQIQILVAVDEADIGSVEAGHDVTFTVDAFPDRVFNGKVAQVRIAGTTTNNVVTYTVVASAENPQQKLLPGMTATVRIITGTRRDVLRVPNEAVRFSPPKGMKTTRAAERPNRDDAIVATLSEKLALSAEQTEKFRAGMAATRRVPRERPEEASPRNAEAAEEEMSTQVSARRNAATGGASGGAPERRGRITRVLEGILTPEQMAAFKTHRDEWRDTTRPANVWTQTQDGLQPHRLQLGLADESFSEVLRGELKAGDSVVARARRNGGGSESGRAERRAR